MGSEADYFLKLDQTDGESVGTGHKGEIEVDSFSWGVSQTGHGHTGGGAGAGKASVQDIHFTAKTSKASPLLGQHCCAGTHLKDATLSIRKAGGEQVDYLVYKLTDIFVTSYQNGGSANGSVIPTDQFSLQFSKYTMCYKEQTDKGSASGGTTKGYDVKATAKI